MSGHIIGRAFCNGIGEVYVEDADNPAFLKLTHIRTGFKYLRRRSEVSFRKGRYADAA